MVLNIPETLSDILHEIGEIAGENAYLVGGSVRDLLLERKNIDIDIAVEGDAISVAKQLQNRWKGTCQTHSQFGTATVTPANPDRPKVDFVTARSETYKKSGTLPKVEPGTLTDDLHRRDFSINALAMCLGKNVFGTIIDETGGIEDLKNGIIRVLHNNSYNDDPTRIFRAYRYSGRYNFNIAEPDKSLIEKAVPLIADLSGERIRNEIDRIFLEDKAQQILQDLAEVGVYETIYPKWKITPSLSCDLIIVKQAITWAAEHIEDIDIQEEQLYWMAMFGLANKHVIPTYPIEAICFRLVLPHQLSRVTKSTQQLRNDVETNNDLRSIFDKVDVKLSENAIYEFQNGKWCIVDIDNKETYVYDDGTIYTVQTPIITYRKLMNVLESFTDSTAPSKIYNDLKSFPIESLILGYLNDELSKIHRTFIGDYLLTLRKTQPLITGKDLIQWGEIPGDNFDVILSDLFNQQLDGKIKTKSEAFNYYTSQKMQ